MIQTLFFDRLIGQLFKRIHFDAFCSFFLFSFGSLFEFFFFISLFGNLLFVIEYCVN